ncbi:MAG TPA: hypothetical protein VEP90_11960 [Methylomirabilota bacterium]|nr:hypothetical protein [Methylomirabilota bacterium]
MGAKESGAYESRQRKARNESNPGKGSYGRGRGYTCILCLETFRSLVRPEADAYTLELESKTKGFEELGSDLAHFLIKQDLEIHIELIHGGRKEYWKKVSDTRRMTQIRKLDSLKYETVVNSNQKGKGEKQ